VATNVVGICMRGYEVVDSLKIVLPEIRKHVGAVFSVVASIDEHRVPTRADDERAHRLLDVDEVDLKRVIRRCRGGWLVARSWRGLLDLLVSQSI
jgi:hypothetical protein